MVHVHTVAYTREFDGGSYVWAGSTTCAVNGARRSKRCCSAHSGLRTRWDVAFTRYCYYQSYMVYGIQKRGVEKAWYTAQ